MKVIPETPRAHSFLFNGDRSSKLKAVISMNMYMF